MEAQIEDLELMRCQNLGEKAAIGGEERGSVQKDLSPEEPGSNWSINESPTTHLPF